MHNDAYTRSPDYLQPRELWFSDLSCTCIIHVYIIIHNHVYMYIYMIVLLFRPNTGNANKKLLEVFEDLAQEQGIGSPFALPCSLSFPSALIHSPKSYLAPSLAPSLTFTHHTLTIHRLTLASPSRSLFLLPHFSFSLPLQFPQARN